MEQSTGEHKEIPTMTDTNTRTALITGASRGLGLALARRLAHDGWNLIIDARGEEALRVASAELSNESHIIAVSGSVTDKEHRRKLAEHSRDLGGLDALVNNASILGPSPQPELLDYPLDALEEVYKTNVVAPLALIQQVRGALKPGSRIVNITSDAAREPYGGWGGYGSSKAALEQLSRILSVENSDLRVYWADPGDMRTKMQSEAFPDEDISDRPLPEESVPGMIQLLTGDLPGGRYELRNLPNSEKRPAVREMRVALTTKDFDRDAKLYRDGLGLPVVEEWSSEEGRGLVLSAGEATLELIDENQAGLIDRVEAGERVSGAVRFAFRVDDVEESADTLQAGGAKPQGTPVQTPWGDFNQRLRTPDGRQLTLFQPVEKEPETEVA